MKQWDSELALLVHILLWFIFFQMLLKHKPRAGLWKGALHLLLPLPHSYLCKIWSMQRARRCLMPPSLPKWETQNQTKCLEKCSLPLLQHRCAWEEQAGGNIYLHSNQQYQWDRRLLMGCGTFSELAQIKPVTILVLESHCCLQGAWWSAGNMLENSVFSIKALSTGAGTNCLPLLVVSAVKPKILSHPVSQSLEQIHIAVAR